MKCSLRVGNLATHSFSIKPPKPRCPRSALTPSDVNGPCQLPMGTSRCLGCSQNRSNLIISQTTLNADSLSDLSADRLMGFIRPPRMSIRQIIRPPPNETGVCYYVVSSTGKFFLQIVDKTSRLSCNHQ